MSEIAALRLGEPPHPTHRSTIDQEMTMGTFPRLLIIPMLAAGIGIAHAEELPGNRRCRL